MEGRIAERQGQSPTSGACFCLLAAVFRQKVACIEGRAGTAIAGGKAGGGWRLTAGFVVQIVEERSPNELSQHSSSSLLVTKL